jgi:Ni/Fe-hydrogenase subunit HybB-like protein
MTMAGLTPALPLRSRTVTVLGKAVPVDPRVLVGSLVADVRSMPRGLKAWLAILLALMAVAGIAALIALPPGWEVLGTSPSFEWGLLIIGYVTFAIATSGLCLASSLGTVFGVDRYRPLEKRHAILAVLCLTAAFGIIALDLHWPVRLIFGAVLSPAPSSPMWWMGVFYGGYLGLLLVEVWSMFSDHPKVHQWACTLAACMAILAPATLGAVFGVIVARPYWHGPFTPLWMVASAFLAGVSVLGIVFFGVVRFRLSGFERAGRLAMPGLRLLLGVGLVVVAILLVRHMVAGLNGSELGLRVATLAVLEGPLAGPFWILRVGVGLGLPLLLILLPATRTPIGLLVASAGALTGVFVDRWLFVAAGQVAPVSVVGGVVMTPYAGYGPSPVEIAIILGAAAFVAFGYTLAERYLDLNEADVHFGFPLAPHLRRARAALVVRVDAVRSRLRRPPAQDAESLADPVGDPLPRTQVDLRVGGPGVVPPPAGRPVRGHGGGR